jgi:hypothetical protein
MDQFIKHANGTVPKASPIVVRNYMEGIMRICEVSITLGLEEPRIHPTGTFLSSANVGTAKQRFKINSAHSELPIGGKLEIIHEFPDIEGAGIIKKEYDITDTCVVDAIVPNEILLAGRGTTTVVQSLFILFPDGLRIAEVGSIAINIVRSIRDEDVSEWQGVYIQRFEDLYREIRRRVEDMDGLLDSDNVSVAVIKAAVLNELNPTINAITSKVTEVENRLENKAIDLATTDQGLALKSRNGKLSIVNSASDEKIRSIINNLKGGN